MKQRYWDDVEVGESLASVTFPITVYRLVMAAGANRDFNSIHHNAEYARASGAPDIFANNFFLQGMWERAVREYIGLAGTIRRLSGFRMRKFATPGTTLVVKGEVLRRWLEDGQGHVECSVWSEDARGMCVGPGRVIATLPLRSTTGDHE